MLPRTYTGSPKPAQQPKRKDSGDERNANKPSHEVLLTQAASRSNGSVQLPTPRSIGCPPKARRASRRAECGAPSAKTLLSARSGGHFDARGLFGWKWVFLGDGF